MTNDEILEIARWLEDHGFRVIDLGDKDSVVFFTITPRDT